MDTTILTPPTPSTHRRTPSANIRRIALQRRTTKGPLGLDDPLTSSTASLEQTSTPPPEHSTASEPLKPSTIQPSPSPSTSIHDITTLPQRPLAKPPSSKDFSFLLRPEIYQPLTDADLVPTSSRNTNTPLPPSSSSSSTEDKTTHLQTLLSQARYHSAATYTATLLTDPNYTTPTNAPLIFSLLHTRLTCLLLLGRTAQAAEESKALQDLGNPFYLSSEDGHARQRHVVPWALRVLVVRLQAIGFGEARRGIVGFYELAREARGEVVRSSSREEGVLWKERLRELGVYVANTLVEMGDLQGAARHLKTLKIEEGDHDKVRAQMRLALVYLRLGDRDAALRCFPPQGPAAEQDVNVELSRQIVLALSTTAAAPANSSISTTSTAGTTTKTTAEEAWSTALNLSTSTSTSTSQPTEQEAYLQSNHAVSLVYAGRIGEARVILEKLISESSEGGISKAILFNLCTILELTTEKARDAKLALAEKVAAGGYGGGAEGDGRGAEVGMERGLGDFKL